MIVFFDGVCSLCNGFIDFLVRRIAREQPPFYIASLQGQTAETKLSLQDRQNFESVILLEVESGKILKKSDAILEILVHLGGLWKCLRFFRYIPRVVRDGVYDGVAKRRYAWFGKREHCRLPTLEERKFFLP
jgi:predicted DCC family thiol-disulfide oxidoreductase YuxK